MTQETSGAKRFQMRFRSICPLIVILILAVVFDSGAHLLLAADDELSVEGQGMKAVAIIFLRHVGTYGGSIDINSAASPPWSEARIKNTFIGKDLYLRRNADERCRFDLGFTVEKEDGMPTMGKLFASIRFDRLSREYETTPWGPPPFDRYNIIVHGLPGALCERDRCFADFHSGALLAPQLRQMTRALKFVFDHVCSPVEFPLEKQ